MTEFVVTWYLVRFGEMREHVVYRGRSRMLAYAWMLWVSFIMSQIDAVYLRRGAP